MTPGITPCADEPTLWFAPEEAAIVAAKALCRICPQQIQCLRGAVERAEPWGVWGGELFHHGVIASRLPRPPRQPAQPR
jgi:WhiB family redox-sensing transcriptional regulator